ncbi:MAG: hypothetical protein LBO80_12065 [Treponema sp.]|nr:hypothetical protein [Treponema sp.]
MLGDTIAFVLGYYVLDFILQKTENKTLGVLIYGNASQLFPIFFNAGITLLGFLLTGLSIVLMFLKDEALEPLKEHGHFKAILQIYLNAILVSALFTAISFLGLVLETNQAFACVTGITIFVMIARIWRCVWIIEQITIIIFKNK